MCKRGKKLDKNPLKKTILEVIFYLGSYSGKISEFV
jgi:hypothetical protein